MKARLAAAVVVLSFFMGVPSFHYFAAFSVALILRWQPSPAAPFAWRRRGLVYLALASAVFVVLRFAEVEL